MGMIYIHWGKTKSENVKWSKYKTYAKLLKVELKKYSENEGEVVEIYYRTGRYINNIHFPMSGVGFNSVYSIVQHLQSISSL